MISRENIKYSLKNLWERKSRSLLTILSILIGITTIFIFVSFGMGLYLYVDDLMTGGSANKFTVTAKGMGAPGTSSIEMLDGDLNIVEKTKGVVEVLAMKFTIGEVESRGQTKYAYITGYDPRSKLMEESFNMGIERGKYIRPDDKNSVMLGYNYQLDDKIFAKGLDIGSKIIIDGTPYRVSGFFGEIGNPSDDANVYLSLDGFDEKFPDTESYAMIFGEADIDDLRATVDRVEKRLRNYRDEEEGKETLDVASFAEQLESFQIVLNMIIGFIIMIAAISIVVSAINTANTMITSVLERTKEIGIIKSIGGKNSEILNIFLFESSTLGFTAGILGITFGYMCTETGGKILSDLGWGFLAPHYSIELFLGCLLFATIVGTISGVAPAINAAHKKPVDALRTE